MLDRLNFFEPWEHLTPNHENQLTRAFLVVMRYCPLAHQAWLSLVHRDFALHRLPKPTFHTQRAKVLQGQAQQQIQEPIKGISVLCSADAVSGSSGAVLESDRGQVLDGIIRYGDEIVIVLESKLDGPGDDRQAANINNHGQPIVFDTGVQRISWSDVLAAISDLADDSRGVVSGAEKMVLSDFLSFVDVHFPQLGPFNNLRRCESEPSRVARRLQTVLTEALGGDGVTLPGNPLSVTTAYLRYDDGRHVDLLMYPADTLEQARVFYSRHDAATHLLLLIREGWEITPNFHFGFMAKGFDRTETTLPLANYMSYWRINIGQTAQVASRDWNEYWSKLVEARIARPEDRHAFDENFTNTNRGFATPRPGLICEFSWPLGDAEILDARGQFTQAVKHRINQLLESLGEVRIMPGDRP